MPYCSNCRIHWTGDINYCPNCGRQIDCGCSTILVGIGAILVVVCIACTGISQYITGGGNSSRTAQGLLVLYSPIPARVGVVTEIYLDGQVVQLWPVGTTEVQLRVSKGSRRIQILVHGALVFDTWVNVGERTEVLVK